MSSGQDGAFKPKIADWKSFKATIFKIYDARIFDAPEIGGVQNTAHLGLDEHLLIYMI